MNTDVKGTPPSTLFFQAVTQLPSMNAPPLIFDLPGPQKRSMYVAPGLNWPMNLARAPRETSTYRPSNSCFSIAQGPTSSAGKPSSPLISLPIGFPAVGQIQFVISVARNLGRFQPK